jgi:hypothetical protein
MKSFRNIPVIASPTQSGVAIQLDCFVATLLAMTTGSKA